MKKTLIFISFLYVSLLSCKTETSLNTENVAKSSKQIRYGNGYHFVGGNWQLIGNLYYNSSKDTLLGVPRYEGTSGIIDSSIPYNSYYAFIDKHPWGVFWKIMYISIGQWPIVKIFSFEEGSLSINDSPNAFVIDPSPQDGTADWELIGIGNPLAEEGESPTAFIGVIVNKKTGQMLEANRDEDGRIRVFASKKWASSQQKWLFEQTGDWSRIVGDSNPLKKSLWKIARTPKYGDPALE